MMLCPACNSRYEEEIQFCPRDGTPVAKEATGDDLVGQVLDDRYRIVRRIGMGGMGEVFEARHVYIEKRYALKLLRKEIMSNAEAVTRFHKEARAASAIGHDNIVEIDDFGRLADGRVYLTMEYLEGESLAEAARSPVTIARAEEIIWQVCQGLKAAHEKGIIHRDLKPENIFLTKKNGRELVKILDFGIAKVVSSDGAGPSNLTRTGVIFGTPHYMSPEQAQGAAIDERSDIYAVGIILYELLVGQVPFRGNSFMAILMRHITEPPKLPREAAPERNIPIAIERIAMRAMAKSPADRYRSVAELTLDLEAVKRGEEGRIAELPPPALPPVIVAPLPERIPADVITAAAKRGVGLGESGAGSLTRELMAQLPGRRRGLLVVAGMALVLLFSVVVVGRRWRRASQSSTVAVAPLPHESDMAPAKVVTVLLDTDPSGASIIRDGRYFSETPEQVEVPAGATVVLGLHRDNFRDVTVTIDPARGRKMMVKLERAHAGEEHHHAVMPPPSKHPKATLPESAGLGVPPSETADPTAGQPSPGLKTQPRRRNRDSDEPINPY